MSAERKSDVKDARKVIVDKIIEGLEKGEIPWKKPWKDRAFSGMPRNAVSGRPYHGMNVLLLMSAGRTDPRWCTYEAAKKSGWQVKSGERATPIVRCSQVTKTKMVKEKETDPETGEIREKEVEKKVSYWMFKLWKVFNAEQLDGIPSLTVEEERQIRPTDDDVKNKISEVLSRIPGVSLHFGGNEAYYSSKGDFIRLPEASQFEDQVGLLGVFAHEATHATGVESRLDREEFRKYHGSLEERAREELVAEIGSALLCGELGVPDDIDRNVGYIGSWIKQLKDDPRSLFVAVAKAEKAVDLLQGRLDLNEERQARKECREKPLASAEALPSLSSLQEEEGLLPSLDEKSSAPSTPFSLFSNDSPGWLVFDNGGMTFDRYTLFVRGPEGVDAYTLSFNADSPQGVCQFADRHSKRTIPVRPEINEWAPVSPEEIPIEARRSVTKILEEYGHPDPYVPPAPEAGSPELG